jgi:hypothetical protein
LAQLEHKEKKRKIEQGAESAAWEEEDSESVKRKQK